MSELKKPYNYDDAIKETTKRVVVIADEMIMSELYGVKATAGRVETAEVKGEFIHIFGAGIKKALEVADKIILEVLKEKSERPDTDKESLHHFSEKYLRPFMQQKIKNADETLLKATFIHNYDIPNILIPYGAKYPDKALKEKSERPDTDKMTITCGKCGRVHHATEEDWKEANRIKCDGCGRIEPLTPEIKARLQERG